MRLDLLKPDLPCCRNNKGDKNDMNSQNLDRLNDLDFSAFSVIVTDKNQVRIQNCCSE